jgi:transcriptional regulator with XRE-family HTH domain
VRRFHQDVQPFLQERLPALSRLNAPEPAAKDARLGDDRMAVGLLIILLRSLRHWTQEELSRASGIGRRRISDYERGKRLPRRKSLEKLAGAVGAELHDVQKTLPVLARMSRANPKPGSLANEIGRSAAEVFLLEVESFQQGRTAEVKRLADEMVAIFRAQQVPREAMAAVLVFHKAAEQERATVELARRLSDYLRRAQHDPGLRFEE